jgi:hypothetical protein
VTGNARIFFRVIAYISFVVIVSVLTFATVSLVTQGIGIVGSNLVEVEFPPPSISPIYAKPITWLYAASLVFMYSELELVKEKVAKLQYGTLEVCKFVAFFAAGIAFFELAYNLIFWGGELAAQAVLGHLNPDTIANPFPDLKHPINVVFASKVSAWVLIAGVYIFHYVSKIKDERTIAQNPDPNRLLLSK